VIFLDLETFSELDLTKCAVDRYAAHPSTRILMCAYAGESGPVQLWQEGEPLPDRLARALQGEGPLVAWNVSFERTVLDVVGGYRGMDYLDAMVQARFAGLPAGLKEANRVPFFNGQAATSKEKLLINKFCRPQKDGRIRDRNTDPEDWAKFCEYCMADVHDTRMIYQWCAARFPIPDRVYQAWLLDQRINRRGLPIDLDMCAYAHQEAARLEAIAHQQLKDLTGLDNPNSPKQLMDWVTKRGYTYTSLGKEFVKRFVEDPLEEDGPAKDALRLRLACAKTAVKKFPKILQTVSEDGRLREQFKFYGAHTGRWSGRGAQVQNLKVPRTPDDKATLKRCIEDLAARRPVESLDALSFCGRPLIRAPKGKKIVVSDFSSVENRVLAWVSDCKPMQEVYRQGRDPYIDFATRLWDLDYEEVSKELRQKAKPGTLGCGFGLGGGKLVYPCKCACGEKWNALKPGVHKCPECDTPVQSALLATKTGLWKYAEQLGMKLTQEEAQKQVDVFRDAFQAVCELWYYLEEAFFHCARAKKPQKVGVLRFEYRAPALAIILPSGRPLFYHNPFAHEEYVKGGKERTIGFEGVKVSAWTHQVTYGGKLCENVVQAIAADLITDALGRIESDPRYELVGHCHDEAITLTDAEFNDALPTLNGYMATVPDWAAGLLMAADGAEGERYAKG